MIEIVIKPIRHVVTVNDDGASVTAVAAQGPSAAGHQHSLADLIDSGVAVTKFSADGTLAGNSDLAVPTEKAVKTYVDANLGVENGIIEGYINGFAMESNAIDPDHDIDISTGFCADAAGTGYYSGSAMTKSYDTAFSKGDGGGLMDDGYTGGQGNWHIHLATEDSTGDVDYFINNENQTILKSGWTYRRTIGVWVADSSSNLHHGIFTSDGVFQFKAPPQVYFGTLPTTPTLFATEAPSGYELELVIIGVFVTADSQPFNHIYISSPMQDGSNTLSRNNGRSRNAADYTGIHAQVLSDTSGRFQLDAEKPNGTFRGSLNSWKIDRRIL